MRFMQFRAKDSYSLALSKLEKVSPPARSELSGSGPGGLGRGAAEAWHLPSSSGGLQRPETGL